MTQVNVLFINGWGGALTSVSLAGLCDRTRTEFGRSIYAPPPVDYTNESMVMRYLDKWVDVQILVMLSCGCSAGAKIAALRPNERIPYAAFYSPSRPCGILGFPIPKNIDRATQITSNPFDIFNPFGPTVIKRGSGNNRTEIDVINSGRNHGFTPGCPVAQRRLWDEIQRALRPVA
jgi:hypothetical protein